jgi:hypothetical protein
VDELALLADIQDPKDIEAMRAALPYVEQWQLVQWTTQVNLRLGVAPSTESVLQRYEERRQQLPEAVRPPGVGVPAQTSARVWAGTWRRRWGGTHGRIRVREHISVEELRSKAPGKPNTKFKKIWHRCPGMRSRFGNAWRSRFGNVFCAQVSKATSFPPSRGLIGCPWVSQPNPGPEHRFRSQNGNVFLYTFSIFGVGFSILRSRFSQLGSGGIILSVRCQLARRS